MQHDTTATHARTVDNAHRLSTIAHHVHMYTVRARYAVLTVCTMLTLARSAYSAHSVYTACTGVHMRTGGYTWVAGACGGSRYWGNHMSPIGSPGSVSGFMVAVRM